MGQQRRGAASAAVLAQLGIAAGDALEGDVAARTLALRPARPRYVLAELIAQCDPDAAAPVDMAAWDAAAPAGGELL